MCRKKCEPHELVLRAIRNSHWNEKKRRYSSELFKGSNTSVSRLEVLSFEKIFEFFHSSLDRNDRTPPWIVVKAGEIKVSRLQEIGKSYDPPIPLSVEQDPITDPPVPNPAHAIIPEEISTGLAKQIIKALILRDDPSGVAP
ncbi:MAG: hypothetical protein HGB11_03520 [Chlorobiales bacterium]|jgi:hypothetical protein|nr:hypothetical protein [Chlorobiales bacterium]